MEDRRRKWLASLCREIGEVGRGWARLGDVLDGINSVLITMEANHGLKEHLSKHKCNQTDNSR